MSEQYRVPSIYDQVLRMREAAALRPLRIQVPGSKSITNRALLLATLAQGTSTLRGTLFSDDSRHFLRCIQTLGFDAQADEENHTVRVTGLGGRLPGRPDSPTGTPLTADVPEAPVTLHVGSAGTAARFLTAFLGLSGGTFHMTASPQMSRRPMAPLLRSLEELGCEITYGDADTPAREGFFPFTLHGHGFGRDQITVDIEHSSQFLSALLISSCLAQRDFTIRVEGKHGMAYIEMTRRMMEQFGVTVSRPDDVTFVTQAHQHYQSLDYRIEPDVSAACYFYALAPLLNVPVLVEHIRFDSLQGDTEFLRILEKMGCLASDTPEGILLQPPAAGTYPGVTADMSACSDQAITLAVLAPFAQSPTTITGIGHIRLQESDRLSAITTELTRMGIRCDATGDSLTVYPGTPKPTLVRTYDDHRMAMGFSLIGLRSSGIVIDDPLCCRKTFENYFEVLDRTVHSLLNMLH